jgi:hypothetical protein
MSESRNVWRSIVAVLAGAFVGIVLSLITDFAMEKIGLIPGPGLPATDGPLAIATVYRTLYGVIGAYVAARLAPSRPMLHAIVLGFLGFVVSIIGAVATWNHVPSLGPHWYPVLLVVLALPTAWFGGRLVERRSQ